MKRILATIIVVMSSMMLCQVAIARRLKFNGIHTITFPLWSALAAVPTGGGVLSREQLLIAVEQVMKID